MFYEQLLHNKIPKVPKDTDNLTVFLHFWDIRMLLINMLVKLTPGGRGAWGGLRGHAVFAANQRSVRVGTSLALLRLVARSCNKNSGVIYVNKKDLKKTFVLSFLD